MSRFDINIGGMFSDEKTEARRALIDKVRAFVQSLRGDEVEVESAAVVTPEGSEDVAAPEAPVEEAPPEEPASA